MRARLLLNLALALAVLGLALVVWLRPGQQGPEEAPPLTALEGAEVQRIMLTPERGEAFTLAREDGAWHVVEPARVRARQYRVESLLGLLTTPRRATLPAPATGADPYGLAPPKARVRFDDTEIAFGDSNPVDYRRYVEVAGAVHLTDDSYFHHLASTWADWADLALLPPQARLARVVTPAYTLARDDKGGYALTPADDELSADTLAQRADEWVHLQALEVRGERAPETAPEEVVLDYQVGEGPVQSLRFAVVRAQGALRLARRDLPLAYEIAAGEAERLLAPPQAPAGEAGVTLPQTAPAADAAGDPHGDPPP